MSKTRRFLRNVTTALLVASGSVGLYACSSGTTTAPVGSTGTNAATKDDHDHDHGHEHGDGHDHDHGHSHAEHGPHEGTLVGLGAEKAHLELLLDKETGTLTAYGLDKTATKNEKIDQAEITMSFSPRGAAIGDSIVLTLVPAADAKEGESKFTVQSDDLKGVEKFDGAFNAIKIAGGEFSETTFKYPEGNHEH